VTSEWTTDLVPLDVPEIVRVLDRYHVRYVFVGGIAALAYGYSRLTADADVVPATDPGNLARIARGLRALGSKVYAEPRRNDLRPDGSPPEVDDLDFDDPESLRGRLTWQFSTRAGQLDVLLVIDAAGGYDELARHAVGTEVAGLRILVASLEDIIESKESVGRPKDLAALDELRALLRERDRRDQV
jgi:hypothetical protein